MLQQACHCRGPIHLLVVENTVDTFHDWDPRQPAWMETYWFGAWVPEIATTVYLYHWFRPVLGIYGGGCIIWNDTAYLPWDIPVFHYEVNRPLLAQADLRALELDCGSRHHSLPSVPREAPCEEQPTQGAHRPVCPGVP